MALLGWAWLPIRGTTCTAPVLRYNEASVKTCGRPAIWLQRPSYWALCQEHEYLAIDSDGDFWNAYR